MRKDREEGEVLSRKRFAYGKISPAGYCHAWEWLREVYVSFTFFGHTLFIASGYYDRDTNNVHNWRKFRTHYWKRQCPPRNL